MKTYILKAINWIAGSADNSPGGASSKKISAFWALVILATITQLVWVKWAYTKDNWEHFEYVLSADLLFAATGLGINSFEKIKGKNNTSVDADPAK